MLAYKNDPEFRQRFLNEIKRHQEQDMVMQGLYGKGQGQNWRGCAVGCAIHSLQCLEDPVTADKGVFSVHKEYPQQLGIPEVLAHLEDQLFELLPVEDAKQWPLRFSEAIQAGADLQLVWPKFAVWLLVDPDQGVIRFAKTDLAKKVISDVADLWVHRAQGEEVSADQFRTARYAADAYAAAAAAYAAAYAADADADAAAAAAVAAAAYAVAVAAYAAGWKVSRSPQHAKVMADKLVELLRAC